LGSASHGRRIRPACQRGVFHPSCGISQVPQTLFGAVETLSQTLPDVILELTVLSAPARSRGVIPEAHPLSNGVRLEWHEVKSETHFTRHSGEGRNPEEWRYWWVLDPGLRREDGSIRLIFVPFGYDWTYRVSSGADKDGFLLKLSGEIIWIVSL